MMSLDTDNNSSITRGSADPTSATIGASVPAPYGRACQQCQKAKCKCLYSKAIGSGSCERCHRLRKSCVPSETVRKRTSRRPIVSRTAQLEEKLDDLVTLLKTQQQTSGQARLSEATATNSPISAGSGSSQVSVADRRSVPNGFPLASGISSPPQGGGADAAAHIPSPPSSHAASEPHPQVAGASASKGANSANSPARPSSHFMPTATPLTLASANEAEECLEAFRTRFLHFFPFFYVPPSMTARQLQEERPLLMLAIMSVTCKSFNRQVELSDRLRSLIAQKAVIDHETSLDNLLAILAYIGWGHFHKREKPFLSVFTRLATAQVMELGLHRPFGDLPFTSAHSLKDPKIHPFEEMRRRPTNEERRAVLGCYYVTSMSATAIKKSDTLRWTAYMEDMLRDLEKDPEWAGDAVLVAQVKLQQLVEHMYNALFQQSSDLSSSGVDTPKGLPTYYVNLLRANLRDIRASLPAGIEAHDAVEPTLYSVELMITESAIERPRPSSQAAAGSGPASGMLASDPQQLDHLHNAIQFLERYFNRVFAIPTMYCHGFSFAFCTQLTHAMAALFRLSVYDDPLWDRAAVRKRLDVLRFADRLAENIMAAPKLVGLETEASGPDSVKTSDGGSTTAMNGHFPNVFLKSWRIMSKMRAGWEAELNKLEPVAQGGGRGAGGGQPSSSAPSTTAAAVGPTAGEPMALAAAEGHIRHQQQMMMGGLEMPQQQQQQQQTPALFGQFDPMTGLMMPNLEDGWFADVFYPWDYQSTAVNWGNF